MWGPVPKMGWEVVGEEKEGMWRLLLGATFPVGWQFRRACLNEGEHEAEAGDSGRLASERESPQVPPNR